LLAGQRCDHSELVAAQPADDGVVRGGSLQGRTDLSRQGVAAVLPHRDVDGVKAVEVEDQHGRALRAGQQQRPGGSAAREATPVG